MIGNLRFAASTLVVSLFVDARFLPALEALQAREFQEARTYLKEWLRWVARDSHRCHEGVAFCRFDGDTGSSGGDHDHTVDRRHRLPQRVTL